jgi:hypothetical protein
VACTVRQVDKRQDVKIVMRAVDYAGDSWLLGLTFDHRLPLGALALVARQRAADRVGVTVHMPSTIDWKTSDQAHCSHQA